MSNAQSISLPNLPHALSWALPPVAWHLTEENGLTCSAGPQTDLFIDPRGGSAVLNAPRLLMPAHGDFLLHAAVAVEFAATFDAGVLLVYAHERLWAKLCFELSPQQQPTIVSVVTRDYSDDANAIPVNRQQVWLRVARLGPAFAFHASLDGESWHLIRYFHLTPQDPIMIGFSVQSPTGGGCTAHFAHMSYTPGQLHDLRSGM